MKTKREIAALVIERLTGGREDASAQYDPRMVMGFIDTCLSEAVGLAVKNNNGQMKDELLSSFVVPIQWDKRREQAYFVLPASLVSLPDDAGLHEIQPLKDNTMPHIIQKNGSQSYFNLLESSYVGTNQFTCYLEASKDGARVWYNNMMEDDVCAVRVKMICGSNGYAEEDALALPGETENYLLELIHRKYVEPRPWYVKMVSDGNPNQGEK